MPNRYMPRERTAITEFDLARTNRLREALAAHYAAGKSKNDTFMFDGHEFVGAYAGYLLEYLDGQLGRK